MVFIIIKWSPGAKEKNVWFWQCLWEKLKTLWLWTLPAFFGVKQPQEAKQHEKRLSQTTCSNKPRNFSRGPGSWKPPRYVIGHCPFLELCRFLEYQQQGHPTSTRLLTGHGISERILSTGTIIDWTDIPGDVMCVSWNPDQQLAHGCCAHDFGRGCYSEGKGGFRCGWFFFK